MLSALTGVTLPNHDPIDFANNTISALKYSFGELYKHTTERVYRGKSALAPTRPHKERTDLSARTVKERLTLANTCLAATHLYCSADEDWKEMQSKIARIKRQVDQWEADKIEMEEWSETQCRGSASTHLSFHKGLYDYLTQFAHQEAFLRRPYMHIIIATILSQFRNDEAALVYLENWLDEGIQHWVKRNPEYRTAAKWLQVRTLTILTLLLDRFITREGSNASLVLREFHIERIRTALRTVDDIFKYDDVLSRFRRGDGWRKFEDASFSASPDDANECKGHGPPPNLFRWYMFSLVRMADQQLQSPRYLSHHAAEVNRTLRELLDVQFGCALDGEPLENSKLLRAETLRLYAQMQLQDANGMRNVLERTVLEAQLRRATRAANLGLFLVKRVAEDKMTEKLSSTEKEDYSFYSSAPTGALGPSRRGHSI